MKKTIIILIMAAMILPCGCNSENERRNLLTAQKSFSATVRVLTSYQLAGKFTPEETENISTLIHEGKDLLDRWYAAVESGEGEPFDLVVEVDRIIDKLITIQLAKGGE